MVPGLLQLLILVCLCFLKHSMDKIKKVVDIRDGSGLDMSTDRLNGGRESLHRLRSFSKHAELLLRSGGRQFVDAPCFLSLWRYIRSNKSLYIINESFEHFNHVYGCPAFMAHNAGQP